MDTSTRQATFHLLLAVVFFSLAHLLAKFLSAAPASQIAFTRAFFAVIFMYLLLKKKKISLRGQNKKLLIWRGLFGTFSFLFFVQSVQKMPLASAVTLQYLAPLFTVIIAWLFFAESGRWFHWLALLLAFTGVYLMQGFDNNIPPSAVFIGLLSALCTAVSYNLIRKTRSTENPLVVIFYFPLVSLAVLWPLVIYEYKALSLTDYGLILLLALLAQIAQYFTTLAYQAVPAAHISHINYIAVVLALVYGWLFFSETASQHELAGMVLILATAFGIDKMGRFQKTSTT